VHSRYRRKVADLPLAGRPVVYHITARKFFCALQQIGRATGGEAGARLARALGMPTSPDTLLGLIRALPLAYPGQPRVVGIDEWAWRKGLRYGTAVVDLDQHRPIALLPERDADAVAAWCAAHPHLAIIARDRAGLFSEAATRGAPQAIQVADRFHLLCNLGEALETLLLRKREHLKATAATMAALTAPAAVVTLGPALYPGKRKTPQRQEWKERAEEDSLRRHARWVAAYEAIRGMAIRGSGCFLCQTGGERDEGG
jgi:transposase